MNAWLLAKKDLAIYLRDPAGLALGLGLPIVLATVFGFAMGAMGGGGGSMPRAKLYVEDRDRSAASQALVDRLSSSDSLRVVAIEPEDDENARERVADGDGPAGLLIDAGYGDALDKGLELPLVLYRDPGKTIEQQIIAGNLMPAFFEVAGERIGQRMSEQALELVGFPEAGRRRAQRILDDTYVHMAELVDELERAGAFDDEPEAPAGDAEGAADDTVPASTGASSDADAAGDEEDRAGSFGGFDFAGAVSDVLGLAVEDVVGNGDEQSAQRAATQAHAVSGIAVMMLLFGLVACGGTLLGEQADGTLDRLRLAPGAGASILGGKFLFTWIIGLAQLAILFVYASFVFSVPIFSAPVALVVLSMAVAAAATGFGILFAVLCRTQAQLEGISTIAILTMSALGGSWWPLAMTPEWFQTLGHFTLNAWAMDGYQGIFWYGKSLSEIALPIGVLLAIAAATSAGAAALWQRRVMV